MTSTASPAGDWAAKGSNAIVQTDFGLTEQPWSVIDIDVADGLPDLPVVNDEGTRIGGFFALIRVFTEPIAALWIEITDSVPVAARAWPYNRYSSR